MTAEQTELTAGEIEKGLRGHLDSVLNTAVEPDQDLFKSGLVSSMFAMQLVVHLEETYDIAIIGADLKLDSFRTVQAMTELVLRLRAAASDA